MDLSIIYFLLSSSSSPPKPNTNFKAFSSIKLNFRCFTSGFLSIFLLHLSSIALLFTIHQNRNLQDFFFYDIYPIAPKGSSTMTDDLHAIRRERQRLRMRERSATMSAEELELHQQINRELYWLRCEKPSFTHTADVGPPHSPATVDNVVELQGSTVRPIINTEPDQFCFAMKHMIHSPFVDRDRHQPCTKPEGCKKIFPRDFADCTVQGIDSYPVYQQRRNGPRVRLRNGIVVDNQWVVPYNPLLQILFSSYDIAKTILSTFV